MAGSLKELAAHRFARAEDFYTATREDAEAAFSDATVFIASVREYLSSQHILG